MTNQFKPVTLGDLYSTPALLATLHDESLAEGWNDVMWNDVMWIRWAAYMMRYHDFKPYNAMQVALDQWRALPGFEELPRLPPLSSNPLR